MKTLAITSSVLTDAFGTALQNFWQELRVQLRTQSLIIWLSLLFFAISIPINLHFGQSIGAAFWPYFSNIFGLVLPTVFGISLVVHFAYMVLIERPQSPALAMYRFYKPLIWDARRWAKAIPTLFFMMLGFNAFADLKGLIPLMNAYSWDTAFMELDRMLHFGQDPWRLLAPVFGSAVVTQILNFVYNFWFIIMFTFWLGAAWTRQDQGWERQFLVSFLLVWMIGGVGLAVLFSSMGPAFYDIIDPMNNPYAAQMISLHESHESYSIWALGTQDMLREAYLVPAPGQLSGISAMPSMHNATSALFMFAAYRINKKLGHALAVFVFLIAVGSVHLAWHYAVDAYFGIAFAWAMWWTAGKLLAAQDRILGTSPR